jgi:hypothetical protein
MDREDDLRLKRDRDANGRPLCGRRSYFHRAFSRPTSRTHPLGPTRQARIVGSVEGSKRATSLPAFPGAFTEVLHTAGLKRLRCDPLMEARRAR